MTLKRKIVLSNILMVVLPVMLTLIAWTVCVHFGSGTWLKPINRSSGGSDLLTEAMNVLYTYEAELSDMHWDVVAFPGEKGADIVVSPERERIEELKSLGYRIQVESAENVSFSNLEEADKKILERAGTQADGAVYWEGSSLVIQDGFRISGRNYYLTAVYNAGRADRGVTASLLPMYMVSPALIFILLAIAAACIILTTSVAAGWMNRSVLVPLDELKKGADMIAGGDLDYRIPYPGRDEFGDVCSEFDHMRLQLRQAKEDQKRYENERRELLRGISHDIRSPLTSIKGYAMGLKDGIADTEEKRQRYYDAILTRTDDLERLTGSLSLLVKLENGSSILQMEKVCLDEYIRQFLEERETWLADQNIKVEYSNDHADMEVRLDIREMQRVFMNLFENTARYRVSDHSKVGLSIVKRGREIEIRFSDDGPGVSHRHLEHLFESFYRADESRTEPGKGSGLGLAVVKRIIEGQNGTIYAVSEGGLCIVMMLPLAIKEVTENEENPDH